MLPNKELRRMARAQLGSSIFSNYWLMMLVACLIGSVIVSITSFFPVLTLIVIGPVSFGLARLSANRAKGKEQIEFGDLFSGFSENFANSCILGLLSTIFIFLWSLLFLIPGIVKSYSYSMAYYIQQDDPSKDWRTALNESRAMMRGYKGKLFLLDLSFIGWYILGALCFGIGILFVAPYVTMARTNFYFSLKQELNNNQTEAV